MGNHTNYSFPSQRKNWSAPRGFKGYRTKGGYTLKKQVDWGELVYRIAVIVIAFFACAGLTLLARMYLYSSV